MPITFVNSTAATITAVTNTPSIATHSSRVGGAAFIVGVGPASSAATVSTVTDNTTNIYRLAARRATPKPAAGAELWYATNISSLSTRVTVTYTGVATSSGSLTIGQWTGVSTANGLDVTGSSAITANSTVHGASQITPSAANSLVVAFARTHASTMSPTVVDGGMSQWVTTGGALRTMGLYIIQVAASTATGQWRTAAGTSTGGVQHASVIAAFLDTATAPVAGGYVAPWRGGLLGVC